MAKNQKTKVKNLLQVKWILNLTKSCKNRELQKSLGFDLQEMIDLAKKSLHPEVYTLDEVCQLLEATKEEIILNSLSQNTSDSKLFKIKIINT